MMLKNKLIYLTIIALMLMQLIYSQTVDTINKPKPLNKELLTKMDSLIRVPGVVLNWSKVITNEQKLRDAVKKLTKIIKTKDSIINQMTINEKHYIQNDKANIQKEIEFLNTMSIMNERAFVMNKQLYDVNKQQLSIEKKKSKGGLYLRLSLGNKYFEYNNMDIGLLYVNTNILFGGSINPVNDYNIYNIIVGYKIF